MQQRARGFAAPHEAHWRPRANAAALPQAQRHQRRALTAQRPLAAHAREQEATLNAAAGAPASSTQGPSWVQLPSRRLIIGTGAAAAAAAAAVGPAGAVQTVLLKDGTAVEAYEHGMTLGIVALRGSVPTQWVLDFRQGLGRYAGFELGQRGQLQEIFDELKDPKAKRSAGAADVVTLGDAWLAPAIKQGLIQPMPSAETYRWWRRLPRRWQQLVRRGPDGRPSDAGAVWGCPYRWGATLVAYRRDALERRGGRPVRDWADLLQPQLKGKIAFSGSSREFVGIALKTLAGGGGGSVGGGAAGLGFNSGPAALAAAGASRQQARARVRQLLRQARAFSDRDHVRTLMAGDTLAVVGTSEDLVPLAERTPSLELVAPAGGVPLWADVWAVPRGASGGHLKAGPSPILPSWLEFGILPARAATLGSLRTGATPLLLSSLPPPPPAPHAAHGSEAAAGSGGGGGSDSGGPLGWLLAARRRWRREQRDDAQHRSHHHSHADGGPEAVAAAAAAAAAALPPLSPEDALLGGPQGYLPSAPVLLRSEFLLPLDDGQLELYQWLLGRDVD